METLGQGRRSQAARHEEPNVTIAQLMQTYNDAYTEAVVQGSGLTANAARTAAEAAYGVEQLRTRIALLRDRAAIVRDRADADGATLTDLFLYLAAQERCTAANVLLGAMSWLATGEGCDAEVNVYDTAAIRTVSEFAANGVESTLADAAEDAAKAHAEHADTIAAAEQVLVDTEANLVRRITEAQNVADLDPADVLDVRGAVFMAALNAAEARAKVRSARLAAALAAADAEADAYDLAYSELSIDVNPWMDPDYEGADI
jgi:hypothetical protein